MKKFCRDSRALDRPRKNIEYRDAKNFKNENY